MRRSDAGDDLIHRWQRGDTAAFAALVLHWQQPIARFLARLVGPAFAPDLTQEVFFKLYRSAGKYCDQGQFRAWLYRIALNSARDHQRRRVAKPALYAWIADEHLVQQESAGQTMVRVELCQAVESALNGLPAVQREALVLRHYEQMSFEEMARLLGTPATTLKSRFAAALVRVKEDLTQQGWSAEDLT